MPWSLFEAVLCSLNNDQSSTTQTNISFAMQESDSFTFDELVNFLNRVLNLIAIIQYKAIPGKRGLAIHPNMMDFRHERMKVISHSSRGISERT